MNAPTIFWPGTKTVKSLTSGFTLGFLGVPHGYVAGAPAREGKAQKSQRAHRAFNTRNGTIANMGSGAV